MVPTARYIWIPQLENPGFRNSWFRVEMKVNRKVKTTEQLYSTATKPELFMNGVLENRDFSWTAYVCFLTVVCVSSLNWIWLYVPSILVSVSNVWLEKYTMKSGNTKEYLTILTFLSQSCVSLLACWMAWWGVFRYET